MTELSTDPVPSPDFHTVFVSYTSADRTWAEWIAWTLEEAGYKCTIQAWDFGAGGNFALDMQKAAAESDRTIAVLSEAYLKSGFTRAEWAAAFTSDPTGAGRKLIPVRVAPFKSEGLLQAHVYIDLIGLEEAVAKEQLLNGVGTGRAKPTEKPAFPSTVTTASTSISTTKTGPVFPVNPPQFWTVPPVSRHFTGRTEVLAELREVLEEGQRAALVGTPGVGKTQTAIRYAELNRSAYRHAFWISAADEVILQTGYAAMAAIIDPNWKFETDKNQTIRFVLAWLNLRNDWLLVIDNADNLAVLNDNLLPDRTGHLLITTRNAAVARIAHVVNVGKMSPVDGAICFLNCAGFANPTLEEKAAAELISRDMDGLPLALDQAGAYVTNTGCSIAKYHELYSGKSRGKLLDARGAELVGDERTVYGTFTLAVQQAVQQHPAAEELLQLCAFIASDDIPEHLFTQNSTLLTEILRGAVADELEWNEMLAAVRKLALIERHQDRASFSVHRLLQDVLRATMDEIRQQEHTEIILRVLKAIYPGHTYEFWSYLDKLLPHYIACIGYADSMPITSESFAFVCHRTAFYLNDRANYLVAEPIFIRALKLYEQIFGADSIQTAMASSDLAFTYQEQGRLSEAEPLIIRTLDIREKALAPDHPDMAISLNNLATLYQEQGRLGEAEPLFIRALDIREKIFGPYHPDTAMSMGNLATLYQDQGRLSESEPLLVRALDICERTLGLDHPNIANNLNNLANLYQKQGKLNKAKPLFTRALDMSEKIFGPYHPDTAIGLNNLATLYQEQGRLDEAEPLFIRALGIYERVFGPYHPDTAMSMGNLATLYQEQGRLDEAEPLFIRALDIREKIFGPYHSNTDISLSSLAALYREQGRLDEAEPLLVRSLDICERVLEPDYSSTVISLNNLAALYQEQGRLDEAEPLFIRALDMCEINLGQDHPTTKKSRSHLIWFYMRSNIFKKAAFIQYRWVLYLEKVYRAQDNRTKKARAEYVALLKGKNPFRQKNH